MVKKNYRLQRAKKRKANKTFKSAAIIEIIKIGPMHGSVTFVNAHCLRG